MQCLADVILHTYFEISMALSVYCTNSNHFQLLFPKKSVVTCCEQRISLGCTSTETA